VKRANGPIRFRLDGQIDGRHTRFAPRLTPEQFWENTTRIPDTGCWIWLGSHERNKYGCARVLGEPEVTASRVAWVLANGRRIPGRKCVLHKCDVKGCVNPAHLELGSRKKNARDAWARVPGLVCRRKDRRAP
jgi:hypothetical protein